MFYSRVTQYSNLQNIDVVELIFEGDDPQNNILVAIAPQLGSNLFKFRVGEKELIYCDYPTLQNRGFTGNYVLFPFPGRIKNKRYNFDGENYSLEEINRFGITHLVHGLVFDQKWSYEEPIIRNNQVSLKTYIDINKDTHHFKGFPFECRLSLNYLLSSSGVKIEYEVINKSDKVMPFGFGLHPYFNASSGKENCYVSLPANAVMEADEELIPTGKLFKVSNSMYDLRKLKTVSLLNLDHVYSEITNNQNSRIRFENDNLELNLEVSNDFTHLVIFTANKADPFFCIENQTCSADAINLFEKGFNKESHLLILNPLEKHTGFINYKVVNF